MRSTCSSSSTRPVIGATVQPGATVGGGVGAAAAVCAEEQAPAADRGLPPRVVGTPGLAEDAGGRADEDERSRPPAELREEAAGGEERRGQVRVDRLAPPLEREIRDGNVLRRPDAGDGGADVGLAPLRRHARDVGLLPEVRLDDPAAARRLRPVAAAVVVDDHLGALGGEETGAGGADPTGAAGDEHACLFEARLHTDGENIRKKVLKL